MYYFILAKPRVIVIRLICLFLGGLCHGVFALDVVTYPKSSKKESYTTNLLTIVMEESRDKFGDYEIELTPKMSLNRTMITLEKNTYTNFIRVLPPSPDIEQKVNLRYVAFPVRLGILGYRICATSLDAKKAFSKVNDLKGLHQFTYVQGANWPDTSILRFNGLKVNVLGQSEFDTRRAIVNMYEMVDRSEVDLFCRAAYEVLIEEPIYEKLRLHIDRKNLLYYPFPLFFYTNKNNERIAQRLLYGLEKSYSNGKVQALWAEIYGGMMKEVNMPNRKVIKLENNWMKNIDSNYEKYIYKPQMEAD